jgi:hypothetical protein
MAQRGIRVLGTTWGFLLVLLAAGCGPDAHSPNPKEPPGPLVTEPELPSVQTADAGEAPLVVQPLADAADAGPSEPVCENRTLVVGARPLGYRASGEVCDGLRQGPWKFTDLNGKALRMGSYQDGLETGKWTFWYSAGGKRSEGKFESGQRVGPWFRNHPNGQRSLQGSYLGGLRNGRWRRWHDNGQLYEDRIYLAGRREGVHHKWSPEGLLQYTRLCKDDVCKIQCRARRQKVCPPLNANSVPK